MSSLSGNRLVVLVGLLSFKISWNRAPNPTSLKFCMEVGIVVTFQKLLGDEFVSPSGGHIGSFQMPSMKSYNQIILYLCIVASCIIPLD